MNRASPSTLSGILFPQYEKENTNTKSFLRSNNIAGVTRVKESSTQKLDLITLYTAFRGMFGTDVDTNLSAMDWPRTRADEAMEEGEGFSENQNFKYTGDIRSMTDRFAKNLKQIGLANNYDKVQQYKIYNPVYADADEFSRDFTTVSDPSGALFNTEMSLYDLPLLYTKKGGTSPQSSFVVKAINRRYGTRDTAETVEKYRQEVVTWNHATEGPLLDTPSDVTTIWDEKIGGGADDKFIPIPMTIIERIQFYH